MSDVTEWSDWATTFSQCIPLCLFKNGVILIMMMMILQYHQVLQYRRWYLQPSYEWWPVRTMVRLKINKTCPPCKLYQWTSQNLTETKPNPRFFQNRNRNRTEVQKSIPHIPIKLPMLFLTSDWCWMLSYWCANTCLGLMLDAELSMCEYMSQSDAGRWVMCEHMSWSAQVYFFLVCWLCSVHHLFGRDVTVKLVVTVVLSRLNYCRHTNTSAASYPRRSTGDSTF